MKIKASLIVGVIVAIIGFVLMTSSIFGFKLDFIPIQNGIFSLGLVTIVIGLIIAAKFSNEEY